jgi:Cu/Ag efflux protein CusF
MMRLWRVALLVNVALVVGLWLGWVAWGRHLPRLEQELGLARQQAPPPGVERVFTAQGVVRAVLRESGVLVLSHEDIPGFMPAMTMGFRTREPSVSAGVEPGDVVRFTLRGVPPSMEIVSLERLGRL